MNVKLAKANASMALRDRMIRRNEEAWGRRGLGGKDRTIGAVHPVHPASVTISVIRTK
jgi:hypothetical protein